jgi:CDP-glucose 4,6-dehydratase
MSVPPLKPAFSWHRKRIFLSRHTGFKEGWLSLWLASKGAVIHGYALAPSTEPNLCFLARSGSEVDDSCGDIRDDAALGSRMQSFAPEVVFHMAAQPLVRLSYGDPIGNYETNVIGTARVLDSVRRAPSVRAVVSFTTNKCHQNKERIWGYRDTDPLGGYDPYSSSKTSAEGVSAVDRQSYFPIARLADHGIALATARSGDVIGGGDWSLDRLIPELMSGLLESQPARIRDPHAIRPWQHVREPLRGYIRLTEQLLKHDPKVATACNFGPHDDGSREVAWIARNKTRFCGNDAFLDEGPGANQTGYLKLDASRARADPGWTHHMNLETTLDWLVRWYHAWQSAADRYAFTLAKLRNVGYMRSYLYNSSTLRLAGNRLQVPHLRQSISTRRRRAACFLLALFLAPALCAPAQTRQSQSAATSATIHALFLSDVHLDPYADPAKIARLNSAPASDWPAILAAPDSPTQAADFDTLQKACPVRGIDTPNVLWQSSLAAIRSSAPRVQFVTISGDLLAHRFDCKYRTLIPGATPASYLAFIHQTIRYIVKSLQQTLPGVPIYIAMGNNDSGCTDYALDPTEDKFLAGTVPIVVAALPADLSAADRGAVQRDFSSSGDYNVPLAAMPHTRLIVLDDLFLSARYVTCSAKPDLAPAAAQLAWLHAQLAAARRDKEHVWVLGHIPPGVDLYATARKLTNVCDGGTPQMFLGSESLAETLAANADIVTLALFGHTHSDEIRLLTPKRTPESGGRLSSASGVPLKIVASITPVNGNRPTFTVATINPTTATLIDYTVFMASNLTGVDTTWSPEYTFSTTYHQPQFDASALSTLIAGFQADPAAANPLSHAYLRDYYPGDVSAIIKFAWPQYACSLDNDSGAAFTACVCAASK